MSTTSSNRFQKIAIRALVCSFAACLGAAPADSSNTAALKPYEAVEPHMGTLFRIKLYAPDAATAEHAFRAAFDRVASLDDTLSDYKPASELNRICKSAVGRPVKVSGDLLRVLIASEQLAAETGGEFDITLGPVIHLWRQARKDGRVPDTAELARASANCGYRKLHVDPVASTVELDDAGMELDVGGIAKGYAADEALKVLGRLGIQSALVAASGDLAFSNAPPGRPGWSIGIDSFDRANAPFTRVLHLSNAAVSTSGDTEQHLDAGGKRYSHIVDPKTDVGLTKGITVTIVARHGIEADGLATAVSVIGATRGMQFIDSKPGVAALIVKPGANGPEVLESSRFHSLTSNSL
ncbi:MAG TPA: FAD:protein FMN transferase [Bryobacteraceae bacterium]|nr:FAD:protein FMN transferase [Bryobacteraceae bacterium]